MGGEDGEVRGDVREGGIGGKGGRGERKGGEEGVMRSGVWWVKGKMVRAVAGFLASLRHWQHFSIATERWGI